MGNQKTRQPREKKAESLKSGSRMSDADNSQTQTSINLPNISNAASPQDIQLTPENILYLQRTVGNRAVASLLSKAEESRPTVDVETNNIQSFQDEQTVSNGGGILSNFCELGGLKPGFDPELATEGIGGRTVGEVIGDAARPVGTVLGNVVGSVAGALTGSSISSTTNVGPTWSNHGQFLWQVGFNTAGRDGWIVQEIVNTMRAEDASGNPAAGWRPTPRYWEAWPVDGSGNVTPNIGADNDYWTRPSKGSGTQGHWSMSGSVYFTKTDPTTQGFTAGGVSDAGILLSTTSAPSGLGIARLHRYAQGTWDSTGTTPTHTGSAM